MMRGCGYGHHPHLFPRASNQNILFLNFKINNLKTVFTDKVSDCIKSAEFLDYLCDYQLLKEDSAPFY
jgi:hypothetical protein